MHQSDQALEHVNKKTWRETRPTMICQVLAFLSTLLSLCSLMIGGFWPILFISLTGVLIIFSVHQLWLLEIKI
jgi:hypothetical protein